MPLLCLTLLAAGAPQRSRGLCRVGWRQAFGRATKEEWGRGMRQSKRRSMTRWRWAHPILPTDPTRGRQPADQVDPATTSKVARVPKRPAPESSSSSSSPSPNASTPPNSTSTSTAAATRQRLYAPAVAPAVAPGAGAGAGGGGTGMVQAFEDDGGRPRASPPLDVTAAAMDVVAAAAAPEPAVDDPMEEGDGVGGPEENEDDGAHVQQRRQPLGVPRAAPHPLLQPQAASSPVNDENDPHAASGGAPPRPPQAQAQQGEEDGEQPPPRFYVGMKLDVLDTAQRWCEAQVTGVDPGARTLALTYLYWADRYDEADVPWDSDRLAPFQSRTFTGRWASLRAGQRVEAWGGMPGNEKWTEAFVLEVQEGEAGAPAAVKVHVKGTRAEADAWLAPPEGPRRLRPYGRQKASLAKKKINGGTGTAAAAAAPTTGGGRGILRSAASSALNLQQSQQGQQHRAQVTAKWAEESAHDRAIVASSDRYNEYSAALAQHARLDIQPIEGDGNCLFRTVSHQMYGTEAHHRLVRQRCMDYMEVEKQYFEPYVVGDMEAFLRYLEVKRRDGIWGDDPEVQALCEMYDRPAEIWAYDAQQGAKKLRTFHEASGLTPSGAARAPMRLSYYGGGHYDSLVPLPGLAGVGGGQPPLLAEPPGVVEARAIEMARQRQRAAAAAATAETTRRSDEEATEAEAVVAALRLSRQEFDVRMDLETALELSAQQQIQEELLRSAVAQSEEELLRKAMEDSIKASEGLSVEEELLRQAMQESMLAAAASGATASAVASVDDDDGGGKMGPGGQAEEEEGKGAGAPSAPAATAAAAKGPAVGAGAEEEDPDVRAAMRMSMAEFGGGDDDQQLQEALRLSRLEQQQQQQQHGQQPPPPATGAGADGTGAAGEEDPELAAAIALSLSSAGAAAGPSAGWVDDGDEEAYVRQQMATLEAARLKKEEDDLKKALQASLGGDN